MRARYPTSARYSMLPRWRLAERPTSSSTTPAIAFAHRSSRSMPRRSLARPTSQQLPPFESPSMPCDACCPTGTVRCFSRARRRGSRDSPTRPLSQWASSRCVVSRRACARAGATRNPCCSCRRRRRNPARRRAGRWPRRAARPRRHCGHLRPHACTTAQRLVLVHRSAAVGQVLLIDIRRENSRPQAACCKTITRRCNVASSSRSRSRVGSKLLARTWP